MMSALFKVKQPGNKNKLTHWPGLAQYAEHQDRLQNEENHETDERPELVQHIEGDIAMGIGPTLGKLASPAKCGVQRDVSRSDEENHAGGDDEGQGNRSTIIENLIPDRAIQQENPTCGRDRSDMYSGKPLDRKRTVRIAFPREEKVCLDQPSGPHHVAENRPR